ncbi:Periplasmic nitrate reductase component NapL [hydrothermal vent metagenome]|uniref:Periplasmic nitrate reductase component NapL n=1 Tax=hydrothermal vent metagenome TaxID=652676 RepID=A0A3B1E424_9ZZZZ
MHKLLLIFLLTFINLTAKDLAPTYVYQASGAVTNIVSQNNKIYVATNASVVEIFDLKTKKLIKKINVPKIKDFMGDIVDAKIYDVDIYKNKVLITSQASNGFRQIHMYRNNKLNIIISIKQKMFISKAKFIDNNLILFSLLDNEMYLYNYKTKQYIWKINVRPNDAVLNSTFSDFALNKDKTIAIVADESGDLKIVDIAKGKVIKVLANKNLDKVFKVDFKNNIIITAGQDGRCVIYNLNDNTNYILRKKRWFLIYAAGLTPSGNIGAYSVDENNNVIVFNTNTKKNLFTLTQNLMTLSSILFINENEVFITTDSNKFNYYNLQNK